MKTISDLFSWARVLKWGRKREKQRKRRLGIGAITIRFTVRGWNAILTERHSGKTKQVTNWFVSSFKGLKIVKYETRAFKRKIEIKPIPILFTANNHFWYCCPLFASDFMYNSTGYVIKQWFKLLATHYRVMEHLGSLESTQEARVALGYASGNSYASFVLSHIQTWKSPGHGDDRWNTRYNMVLRAISCTFYRRVFGGKAVGRYLLVSDEHVPIYSLYWAIPYRQMVTCHQMIVPPWNLRIARWQPASVDKKSSAAGTFVIVANVPSTYLL